MVGPHLLHFPLEYLVLFFLLDPCRLFLCLGFGCLLFADFSTPQFTEGSCQVTLRFFCPPITLEVEANAIG